MPVIVVGADHPLGEAIAHKLAAPDREVRAFISSPESHSQLRALGIKVAIGDLSDQSHIEAAATSCFTAVFVQPALNDGRELAFATPADTAQGWAKAAVDAKVKRVIWVGADTPSIRNVELATVGLDDSQAERSAEEVAGEVAYLDDLAQLPARD